MLNGLFYWLGGKACFAIGVVSELVASESICSRQQAWNVGAVVAAATMLFVGYWTMRRR